jgi:hypothetical protein
LRKRLSESEKTAQDKIDSLKAENQRVYLELQKSEAEQTKQSAITSQHNEFRETELRKLNASLAELQQELKLERDSHQSSLRDLEDFQKLLNSRNNDDIQKNDDQENEDLRKKTFNNDNNKDTEYDHNYEKKKEHEKIIRDLERRFKEKQSDDEFTINTLRSKFLIVLIIIERLKTFEDSDQALLETNKNLSISLERTDTRAFNLEQKVEKLKKYHKIFKNSNELGCKVIRPTFFQSYSSVKKSSRKLYFRLMSKCVHKMKIVHTTTLLIPMKNFLSICQLTETKAPEGRI